MDGDVPQGRFIHTPFGAFIAADWPGQNESGIRALHDKVIVLPDQAATQVGSILIPDETRQRVAEAATTGIIVSLGDAAFAYGDDGQPWHGERPAPGTRVFFQKYSGQTHTGQDGLLYRLMSYSAIAGVAE